MSGYDFLSGFLGSLGEQMQQKQLRKQAMEDEDRQYQRKLSFEEAVAASRERQQIAAEKRQQMRIEPSAYQEVRNGVLVQGRRRFDPDTQTYQEFGEATPVPQADVGKAYDADGFRWQPQNYGGPRKVGRTEASLDRDASNSRSAASISAADRRAQLAAQNKPSGGDKEANRIDMIARNAALEASAAFNDPNKRNAVLAKYGVPTSLEEPATERQLLDAVLRKVEDPYNRISPMPGARLLNEDGSEEYQPSASPAGGAKPPRSNPMFTAKFAELQKKFPNLNEERLLELFEKHSAGQ